MLFIIFFAFYQVLPCVKINSRMADKKGTFKWFLLAAALLAAMAGYHLWMKKIKVDVSSLLPDSKGRVTGIVYGGDKPSAMVSGEIVREGDTIFGVKVVKIFKDRVEFEKDGKKWRQKVKENPPSIWKKAQ